MNIERVFYSNTTHSTIDAVGADDKGLYSKETLDELRTRYPDAEVISLDEAVERTDSRFRHAPERITRERFHEMLEVLPPEDWQRRGSIETFKLCERTCGNITAIFCRIGDSYWELQDDYTLSQEKVVSLVRAADQSTAS